MQTPSAKYFCPRCRAAFEVDSNFCGRCGADMRRASRLEYARVREEDSHRHRAPTRHSGSSRSIRALRRSADGADPWLGRLVDGRYRVLEVIGRGGMGVVYRIEHQRMGKIAAMKVLHNELVEDPDVARRFQREAEAVSRLNHPNTVQVFDFGRADGALYLVMEFVKGLDLGSLLDRDGPMRFSRAAPLLAQVCAALDEAHSLGVVHRDLKPENLLVTRTHGGQDFVKVLDFGLAKLAERDELSEVTERGSIVGTPYYMAPEQIRGEEGIDHRADIYSFGALMFRVLTGEHAFTAQTPVGVLTKHLTEPAPPPSKHSSVPIDERIDEIVARCMEKNPQDRYPSVRELVDHIEQVFAEIVQDTSSPIRSAPGAWLHATTSGEPAAASTLMAAEIDYGIDTSRRLQRSDLDDFEQRLQARRRLRLFWLPILALVAAGSALWYLVLRPAPPATRELEPNGDVAAATRVAPGVEVRGLIGRRHSTTAPDVDFYRLVERPAADGSQLITAQVTALPNIDLELRLYDDSGRLLRTVDEGNIDQGEVLRRFRVTRQVVVAVTESFDGGEERLPTENVSDEYVLTVQLLADDPRWESEPNDAGTDADVLAPGATVSGFLDHRGDVDVFRFAGDGGRYQLLLSGGPTVPFSWKLDDGSWGHDRRASIELAEGALLSLRRDDPGAAKIGGPDVPAYTIDLSRDAD